MNVAIEDVKFDDAGLVPAAVQDARTGEVLMLAYMNAESLRRTIEEGETWFWSRSRAELWHKGATSGNTQRVVGTRLDCDGDAVVVLVEPAGPACHTGERSCFHNTIDNAPAGDLAARRGLGEVLEGLYALVESRRRDAPEGSYTAYLFAQGLDKILKKVGEESAETIIAAKNADAGPLVGEASDLIYHLLVLLVERGVPLNAVRDELARRGGKRRDS
jgi:phosphoribosyl-ATP pyrophosphohydrolase/phosphoribosyl-AMP cyclohydrolase